jgi:hypothetical protein
MIAGAARFGSPDADLAIRVAGFGESFGSRGRGGCEKATLAGGKEEVEH